eukprot:3768981-Pyramimonas_sp.AAC.1
MRTPQPMPFRLRPMSARRLARRARSRRCRGSREGGSGREGSPAGPGLGRCWAAHPLDSHRSVERCCGSRRRASTRGAARGATRTSGGRWASRWRKP